MILVPSIVYAVLLVAGFAGFVSLLFMGAIHINRGHGSHGHRGLRGLGRGHHAAHGQGAHGARTGSAARGHGAQARQGTQSRDEGADADGDSSAPSGGLLWLIPLFSPLNWFSWFIGAGAAGTLCALAHVKDPVRLIIALLGAALFRVAVVKPLWDAIFKFASEPAGNLEACMFQVVEAVTPFNARGEGLVRMLIDGRSEDVLARLTEADLATGLRVGRGERLMVEEVDPATNTCRVSRV